MPSISTFLVRDVQINSLKFIATVGTGLFAGVALGVSVVDVPTRRELEPEAALKQWCGMFNRAKLLQAPITLVSGLASLAVGYLKKDPIWYLGGSVMLGMGPFTQFAIMPTNKKLLNSEVSNNFMCFL